MSLGLMLFRLRLMLTRSICHGIFGWSGSIRNGKGRHWEFKFESSGSILSEFALRKREDNRGVLHHFQVLGVQIPVFWINILGLSGEICDAS